MSRQNRGGRGSLPVAATDCGESAGESAKVLQSACRLEVDLIVGELAAVLALGEVGRGLSVEAEG